MEISGKISPATNITKARQAAKPPGKPTAAPAAKGDRVELSAQAREMMAARKAIAAMDDMDHEKVARVKAQIKAGTYKVDAGKIADKMIDESLIEDLE